MLFRSKKWEADNSPRTPEEEPHPRFVEAIQKKTYVEITAWWSVTFLSLMTVCGSQVMAIPLRNGIALATRFTNTCDPQTVNNDKKVTDHNAVIPTRNLKDADLSALPA